MWRKFKNFILFAFVILCSSSCKKDKGNTDVPIGTISVTIDGTATTFNYGAKATILNVGGGNGISITGNKKEPAASQTSLAISIVRSTPITTGTYVENFGSSSIVGMKYDYDFIGIIYTSEEYASPTPPVTINITEINSTFVKGTFSGELSGTGIDGNPVKNVFTNGVFYVKF